LKKARFSEPKLGDNIFQSLSLWLDKNALQNIRLQALYKKVKHQSMDIFRRGLHSYLGAGAKTS
jgi:hypothetical protein